MQQISDRKFFQIGNIKKLFENIFSRADIFDILSSGSRKRLLIPDIMPTSKRKSPFISPAGPLRTTVPSTTP